MRKETRLLLISLTVRLSGNEKTSTVDEKTLHVRSKRIVRQLGKDDELRFHLGHNQIYSLFRWS
jgi:hypothetical protein